MSYPPFSDQGMQFNSPTWLSPERQTTPSMRLSRMKSNSASRSVRNADHVSPIGPSAMDQPLPHARILKGARLASSFSLSHFVWVLPRKLFPGPSFASFGERL